MGIHLQKAVACVFALQRNNNNRVDAGRAEAVQRPVQYTYPVARK